MPRPSDPTNTILGEEQITERLIMQFFSSLVVGGSRILDKRQKGRNWERYKKKIAMQFYLLHPQTLMAFDILEVGRKTFFDKMNAAPLQKSSG